MKKLAAVVIIGLGTFLFNVSGQSADSTKADRDAEVLKQLNEKKAADEAARKAAADEKAARDAADLKKIQEDKAARDKKAAQFN